MTAAAELNLEELTGELRVVITGVQVLFAFLLIVPSTRNSLTAVLGALPFAVLWFALPLRRLRLLDEQDRNSKLGK